MLVRVQLPPFARSEMPLARSLPRRRRLLYSGLPSCFYRRAAIISSIFPSSALAMKYFAKCSPEMSLQGSPGQSAPAPPLARDDRSDPLHHHAGCRHCEMNRATYSITIAHAWTTSSQASSSPRSMTISDPPPGTRPDRTPVGRRPWSLSEERRGRILAQRRSTEADAAGRALYGRLNNGGIRHPLRTQECGGRGCQAGPPDAEENPRS